MHYPSLEDFLENGKAALAKGPVAIILAEDAVEVGSTLRHHLAAGFVQVLLLTDPSVPLSYVGNNGSISLGINAEGETEGQLMGVFARNDARAVVGQLWWDRAGAGGAQFDFNWLWGGDAIAAREHPDEATVSRLSFALDQNASHDRKATFGFGIERMAAQRHGLGKDALQHDPEKRARAVIQIGQRAAQADQFVTPGKGCRAGIVLDQ